MSTNPVGDVRAATLSVAAQLEQLSRQHPHGIPNLIISRCQANAESLMSNLADLRQALADEQPPRTGAV
jgi:hypothetical protein